jgi:hypothetical protein
MHVGIYGRVCFGVIVVAVWPLGLAGSASAAWPQRASLTSEDGIAGDFFGFSVSISGDYCIVGARFDGQDSGGCGAAYMFKRQNGLWTEQQKLVPSDCDSGGQFGVSVSIAGEYVVVGAHYDDDESGSAYVFDLIEGVWVERRKLTASDGALGDHFGRSVCISGPYAIVGAPSRHEPARESGSAYVFERRGDRKWRQQAKLIASDADEMDHFGESVSIDGDYALVGAHYNDSDSGSAYVFKRTDTAWTEQARLTAPDRAVGDFFGISVSVKGDWAIVGASGGDDKGINSGAVYAFQQVGSAWENKVKLTASDGTDGDQFGMSVAIDGDYCAVGALLAAEDASDGPGPGSAYLFRFDGGGWKETATLAALRGAPGDYFGTSVSIDAEEIVVGAPRAAGGSDGSGCVYVFGICPAADLNGDCSVDFVDYGAFSSWWMSAECDVSEFCGGADLHRTGVVDWADLCAFAREWLNRPR